MVDKISITSIKKSGKNTFTLDLNLPGDSEPVVIEEITEDLPEEIEESTPATEDDSIIEEEPIQTENIEQEEPEIESFTMNITPANDEEETQQPKRIIIPNEEADFYANGIEEVVENSLVRGTDNIYITEKKYILPIENLDNATYVDNLKGG